MDNKHYFIYRLLVNMVAILLFGVKVGFLYISYLISNILNISGFVSILFIIIIWTCFNSLIEYIMKNTIKKNSERDGDKNNGI